MHTKRIYTSSLLCMDTRVTFKVVTAASERDVEAGLDRAWAAFRHVEATCSRFDPQSELSRLTRCIGVAVPASPALFEAIRFAWEVGQLTDGVFDPTVGAAMERRGFDRHYLTGERTTANLDISEAEEAFTPGAPPVSYRDILLDEERRTIKLTRPLTLDLGAVAKGLAIDLAKRELEPFGDFLIEAGGDVYAHGCNERGTPWRVGVRHPQPFRLPNLLDLTDRPDALMGWIDVSGAAVCTSGGYERRAELPQEHHLLDPRTGRSPQAAISCTVIAPYAMMADAFSTAAFILGPEKGTALLDSLDLAGITISNELQTSETTRMRGMWHEIAS